MSLLQTVREKLLGRRSSSEGAKTLAAPPSSPPSTELPPFSLEIVEQMRFDPQVRIGLGARDGLLLPSKAQATSHRAEVARFVQAQWDRIWRGSAHILLKTKLYGFLPLETRYEAARGGEFAGAITFSGFRELHPSRTRILMRGDETIGFRYFQSREKHRDFLAPQGLVCTFDGEFGNPYGRSLLERAYASWFEKWREGGAKKLLRLRMMKDAFLGDIFWYPIDRQLQLASGESVSWRDVAREMIEARQSGGAMTLPMLYDKDGRKLVDYTPPRDIGGAAHVFAWKSDLDLELWKALEVPPEILEAARVGSGWSGRSVPLLVALRAVQGEFAQLVQCVDRLVLRPLVELNFGVESDYELQPVPPDDVLAELGVSSR